jgi:hypothetical protein
MSKENKMKRCLEYFRVIVAAIVMVVEVCFEWKVALQEIDEQIALAGDLLDELKVQDFRSCMQRDMPFDAPEGVVAVIEEICLEESGLK